MYRPAIPTPKYFNCNDNYKGVELQRNPGISEARFDAFKLPSRMGNRLVYPKAHNPKSDELIAA